MKKILSFLLLISIFVVNAQKKAYKPVLDTIVDIPYIGKNGGAHLLNWKLKDNKIHLLAYSHINGSQVVTNE